MSEIIIFVIGVVLGFVAGALFYRNNIKKLKEEEVQARANYEAAISKLKIDLAKLQG